MSNEVDLTEEPLGEPPAPPGLGNFDGESLAALHTPRERMFDPAPKREQVRGIIGLVLLGMLAGVILLTYVSVALDWGTYDEIKDLLGILLPPVVGLVGSAIGFYFGRAGAESR